MFESDYEDVVQVLRPVAGTLGVRGAASAWALVLDDEDAPIEVECLFSERGRRILDAKGAQVETDGTLLFRGDDSGDLKGGDVIVVDDGRAFEILGIENIPFRGSTARYARADLKLRADLRQEVED